MDKGYDETERLLKRMERDIKREYRRAEKDLQEKIDKYYADLDRKDKVWAEKVRKGEKTEAEYKQWRTGQLCIGKRWENQKAVIAQDLTNTNQIASRIVNKNMADVYAINHNFATYQIEADAHLDTSYTLYNHDTVERLLRDKPDLLPQRKVDIPKDLAWNKRQLQSVMVQGVLQGESIPHLAKRLAETVGDMNRKAAIRNARTMTTSAQNGGRVDAFKRAEALGVDMVQEWRATFDNRTRHSHRQLDGERRKIGEVFSNGCRFPADPKGEPSEVYNCRCALEGKVHGLEPQAIKYRSNAAVGMSYEEWKNAKAPKKPKAEPPKITPKAPVSAPVKTMVQKPAQAVKQATQAMITHVKHTDIYDAVKSLILTKKVAHNPVEKLKEKLTFEQIIERVAGGDDTKGSCSSLTYAYIANKMGYDVLDFRGGASQDRFSKKLITRAMNTLEGIDAKQYTITGVAENKGVAQKLLELDLPHNKEYRLSTGCHAAIIRNTDHGYEYLEMQSGVKNGWHSFDKVDKYHYDIKDGKLVVDVTQVDATMDEVLKERFGCSTWDSQYSKYIMEITDTDTYNNDEFIDLMGYINTKKGKQRKSIYGHER